MPMDVSGILQSAAMLWLSGFDPSQADLFAHNEILIDAPPSEVWAQLIAAVQWPEWYPNAQNVVFSDGGKGPLALGTRFAWESFGFHIESEVGTYMPYKQIGWSGVADQLRAYHAFLLEETPSGCRVVTEEVSKGPGAIEFRTRDPEGLHRGHELWLTQLKRRVEASPESRSRKT